MRNRTSGSQDGRVRGTRGVLVASTVLALSVVMGTMASLPASAATRPSTTRVTQPSNLKDHKGQYGGGRVYAGVTVKFPAGTKVRVDVDSYGTNRCYSDPDQHSLTTAKQDEQVVLSFYAQNDFSSGCWQDASTTDWIVEVDIGTQRYPVYMKFGQSGAGKKYELICQSNPAPRLKCQASGQLTAEVSPLS